MKTAQIYRCTAGTRRDQANLYYIQVNAAYRIEEDKTETRIYNRHNTLIAVFVSEF